MKFFTIKSILELNRTTLFLCEEATINQGSGYESCATIEKMYSWESLESMEKYSYKPALFSEAEFLSVTKILSFQELSNIERITYSQLIRLFSYNKMNSIVLCKINLENLFVSELK
jgi:hypothetical protein